MKTLWSQTGVPDPGIERFLKGDDPWADARLLPHDIRGSAAHAHTLRMAGLLEPEDARRVLAALKAELHALPELLPADVEDGQTYLEERLIARLGPRASGIHLGRSRNDQVALALRLFVRDEMLALGLELGVLMRALRAFACEYETVAWPGYTHMRRAMPSTLGQWSLAFLVPLADDLALLPALHQLVNRSPLGAGPGFGVPLPIDRAASAARLGFSGPDPSTLDAVGGRVRHESRLAQWLSGLVCTLERYYWDLALFTTEEFGYFRLAAPLTTGSSAMPQKRNPDVIEVGRARCREIAERSHLLTMLGRGLPSGYHRDYQLSKPELLTLVDRGHELLQVSARVPAGVMPDRDRMARALTPEVFATEAAYGRAVEGRIPFREAYREIQKQLAEGSDPLPFPASGFAPEILQREIRETLQTIESGIEDQMRWITSRQTQIANCYDQLWESTP
jgi:argininosuccinate lyase